MSLERYTSWLNFGEASYLKPYSLKLLQKIEEKKKAGDCEGAQKLAEQICAVCDREQKAEALVACAKVMVELKDNDRAVEYLKEARLKFTGDRHRVAVVQWLSGWILWQIPDRRVDAMKAWVEAIHCFEQLQAHERADKDKVIWYRRCVSEMKAILDKAIANDGI